MEFRTVVPFRESVGAPGVVNEVYNPLSLSHCRLKNGTLLSTPSRQARKEFDFEILGSIVFNHGVDKGLRLGSGLIALKRTMYRNSQGQISKCLKPSTAVLGRG